MTNALAALQIDHLRGSLTSFTLPFEKNRSLTIIYGENGSGKSSICDALEFLGKGDIGSLNDRGLGKTTKYWSAHGKTAADVSVTLTTANGSCHGSLARNGLVILSPPENQPRVEVFREAQIQSLVEAAPAERYKAVQRFVDVSGIEQSEDALRRLIRELQKSRDIAVAEIGQNEQSLRQFWGEAGSPGTGWAAWAKVEAARDPGSLLADIAAIQRLTAAYAALHRTTQRITSALESLEQARENADAARTRANASAQALAHDASELLSVLSAAQTYFSKHGAAPVCPLCESKDRAENLVVRVDARIGDLEAVRASEAEASRMARAVEVAERQLATEQATAAADSREFQQRCAASDLPRDVVLPPAPTPADIALLPVWLESTSYLSVAWQQEEADRLDKKQFSGALKAAVATWLENREAQLELDCLLPRLERALKIVVDERRKFSDTILTKIAGEVGRLYEQVHPGEGLNKVSLLLDSKKRASLELEASFRGASLPPHAYFSDSHLDTLGICIFLALAKLDDPASNILVLDDVIGSVDEPHVDRLIEMIYAEATHFRHCILTTHYRPWKEKFRWGWLKSGQCQFVELGPWCPVNGLSIVGSVSPDIVRLRALLAETPPDLQLVCGKAGVVLASLLNFISLLYECRVPRRASGQYVLGELLLSIDNKLRAALRIDVLQTVPDVGAGSYGSHSLGPLLEKLASIAQTRNIFGAHFNQLSFQLLEHDALRFAEAVEELSALLVDDERGWPKSDKSGSYWATPGETRRLHPLKRPS